MKSLRIFKIIFIYFFMICITVPSFLLCLGINFQSDENRVLSTKPEFSLHTIDTYPKDFSSYYEDNMPFKNFLVRCNSFISINLFKTSPEKAVILGKDGWLFYNSKYKEKTDTLEDYLNYMAISQEEIEACKNSLLSMQQICENNDAQFVFMIAPNKMTIYGDQFMPDSYPKKNIVTKTDLLVDYLRENTDLKIVYPKSRLLENKDDMQLYYKLDSHWNELGGYIGYRELYRVMFENKLPDIDEITYDIERIWTGDLQQMLKIDTLDDVKYNVEYKPEINVERSQIENGFYSTSDNKRGNKVLMFRDSYATALEKYITKDFTQAHLNWSSVFDENLVSEEHPDVVIFQIVERSVFNLPSINHIFLSKAIETSEYIKENVPQYSSEEIKGYCTAEQNENVLKVSGFSFIAGSESETTEAAVVLIGADASYEVPINLRYRADVEESYDIYDGAEYSGIDVQVDLSNIKKGNYDVYIVLKNDRRYYYHNVRYRFGK